MSKTKDNPENLKLVRSSGNLYRDMDAANPEVRHLKSQLAFEIFKALGKHKDLTQAEAAKLLGLKQPEVSRLKNGKFTGFTIDRLIEVLGRLNRGVKVSVHRLNRRAGAPRRSAAVQQEARPSL